MAADATRMSAQRRFLDENVGAQHGGSCDFLFSPPEASGRPSVLRASQKENVPPRTTARAAKVTFQTPRRDPQTRRLLSPSCPEACLALNSTEGLEDGRLEAPVHSQQFPGEAESGPAEGPRDMAVPSGDTSSVSEAGPGCNGPTTASLVDPAPPSPPLSTADMDSPVAAQVPVAGSHKPSTPSAAPLPEQELDSSDNAGARKRAVHPKRLGKKRQEHQEEAPKAEEAARSSTPPPRGADNLDWDKLGDPNFNPFAGGSVLPPADPPQSSPDGTMGAAPGAPDSSTPPSCQASEPEPLAPQAGPAWGPKDEQFRNPAEVLGTCAELDYLEQFGASSLQVSTLRKQSLYLKFDPLLESPQRPAPPGPAPCTSAQETLLPAPTSQSPSETELMTFDLLGTLDAPMPGLLPCVPCGPIVDVLQYSQKDLDAAVAAIQREKQELSSQCQELKAKLSEMGIIMGEFEAIAYQAMEEVQKQEAACKADMQKVLQEKEQLAADLRSMEQSFFDLLRRFEKQKEAIEGYRTNEALLKKCVEDHMARLEQEGQRYQALKVQAEEKLRLANEEIATVSNKALAEAFAVQASLRKEQMRVQSLERVVEQKTRENEELSRICDDLIFKMEKI
ncbi:transforming acidic coiled-coil-containing protein 3 [Sorex fumeus]|uniref:transforming acidic coiled-coil-containing protein 3 n=1 Tax=Sorex fumeus TaxID=62283 RepID=UPI0024ACD2D1|nr:transforming acidic coiled-coil-containing protein 3 [Sorex fumeus]